MAGNYGYNEIRKVAFFSLAFGEALSESALENSLISKAISFLTCIDEAGDLLSLNPVLLQLEFAELDDQERKELMDECAAEFNLKDKDLERKVEDSLSAGFYIMHGIQAAIKAWKGK